MVCIKVGLTMDGYNDPFPWKVSMIKDISDRKSVCNNERLLEMNKWCNELTDHWGYSSQGQTYMFAYEEHRNWFVLRWG